MGIAVPEDFRREVALAGDWQTTSQKPLYDGIAKQADMKGDVAEESKSALNVGIRKRKIDGNDDEEASERPIRKVWGSTTKVYPGTESDDLDALLNKSLSSSSRAPSSTEDGAFERQQRENDIASGNPTIKQESNISAPDLTEERKPVAEPADAAGPTIAFKKRKSKVCR